MKLLPNRKNRRNALIIFTREPVPGQTKTRLMPYFSAEQCAELHRCMIRDIAAETGSVKADIFIAYTGGEPVYLKKVFRGKGLRRAVFTEQYGGNIGLRMENAIRDILGLGYEKAVLIGTDIPEIEAESIDAAFAMLDAYDTVIGPTEDGGYYLIGMKEVHHEAFDVKKYSTGTVCEETFRSIRDAGLTAGTADTYSDIDTPEDIEGYRHRMREDSRLRASHTGRFLADTAAVSVIVPVYNEAAGINCIMQQLRQSDDICEVIYVDGGSTDDTVRKIEDFISADGSDENSGGKSRLLSCEKGRGQQMNAGALESRGDILFFLHCDSILPEGFVGEIRRCMARHDYGCFGVRFPSRNFFMLTNRIISNHRALVRGLPFGDQGIFIDRRLFFECGMFPELPVMEDYSFALKLRRYGYRPGMTGKRIETSARRYGRGTAAILSTEFSMWKLRHLFRKGVSAEELKEMYRDIR